ncbi:glycine zipper domain-containing protein [Sodalis glossinidius]|uniref:glycine zipper domain-containing protein n=1 Tax=Sodalis glossinidius TaxID=63612 RepID=UPI00030A2276|nr:DUF883 family protein [Sodalis glossinidius]
MFTKTEKQDIQLDFKDDVSLLADTLDSLLKATDKTTQDELSDLQAKTRRALRDTRAKLNGNSRIGQYARDGAQYDRDAAVQTKNFVVGKTWHSLGITTAVGIVVGVLLARR